MVSTLCRTLSLLAEDRGFEPLRAFTQHAFQACALGHYANPPSRRLPEGGPHSTIGRPSCFGWPRSCRLQRADQLGYSGRRPPAWWYLTELPQGRKAARAGELFQVRGGSSHALTHRKITVAGCR